MLLLFSKSPYATEAEITGIQTVSATGSQFDIPGWADFVADYGVTMRYYRADICSCVLQNNGVPDPECSCINGYQYPDAYIERKLLRTSSAKNSGMERDGRVEDGQCNVSIPSIYQVAIDILGNKTYADNEIYHKVSIGDIFALPGRRQRARDILKKGIRDTLKAFDVQRIINVSSIDTQYVYNTDYRYKTTTKEIVWNTGRGPGDGETYTVEYECFMQYIVFRDQGHDRGTVLDYLPKRVTCNLRSYYNEKYGESPFNSL